MASAGQHLIVPCEHCGVEYRQARSDQKFCGGRCSSAAWRARRPRTTRCARCAGVVAFGRMKYCGDACATAAEKARRVVTDGPGKYWARGREIAPRKNCETCGVRFKPGAAQLRRGHGRFCSKPCRATWQVKAGKFGNHTRRGRYGPRADLHGITFRSSWEANFARHLEFIKGACVKNWAYEPETFPVIIRGKRRQYIPDFRIDWNGSVVDYVEIKGRMDTRSRQKIRAMRKQHPNVRLIVIGPSAYKRFAKLAAGEVPHWEAT